MTGLEQHAAYGDVFTLEEWAEHRAGGGIIPSDGCGYWATADGFSYDHDCFDEKPAWATHVAWYNK